jgi:hypothetical protein
MRPTCPTSNALFAFMVDTPLTRRKRMSPAFEVQAPPIESNQFRGGS